MKKLLLGCMVILTAPSIMAQTPITKDIPQTKISTLTEEQKKSLNAKYILGDNELPKNWHFIYGPVGNDYKDKSLRFYAPAPNGMVEFSCNTNGDIKLFYKLIEPKITHIGDVINSNVEIGDKRHLLPSVLSAYNSHTMDATYSASGADVIGMLKVISELPADIPDAIVIKTQDRELSLPSPNTLNGSKATLALCVIWNNRHMKQIEKKN